MTDEGTYRRRGRAGARWSDKANSAPKAVEQSLALSAREGRVVGDDDLPIQAVATKDRQEVVDKVRYVADRCHHHVVAFFEHVPNQVLDLPGLYASAAMT